MGFFERDIFCGLDAKSLSYVLLTLCLCSGASGMTLLWIGFDALGIALLLLCAAYVTQLDQWLLPHLLWGDDWVYLNYLYRAGWIFEVRPSLLYAAVWPVLMFAPYLYAPSNDYCWLLIVFYMNDRAASGAWQFGCTLSQEMYCPGAVTGMVISIPVAIFANYHAWLDLEVHFALLYVIWCTNCAFVAGQVDLWYKASPNHFRNLRARCGGTTKNPKWFTPSDATSSGLMEV